MKRISYIYLDPTDTQPHWQGYTEDFDPLVISVADKIAEQVDLRTVTSSERNIKFIMIFDV